MVSFKYISLGIAMPLAATLAVAGCSQEREPHSFTYYAENHDVRETVLADCASGKMLGDDCANAEAAEESVKGQQAHREWQDNGEEQAKEISRIRNEAAAAAAKKYGGGN